MNRTVYGCLLVALAVFLLVSVSLNVVQLVALVGDQIPGMAAPKEKMTEKVQVEGTAGTSEKIVHLDLEGVISSMEAGGFLQSALPSVDILKNSLEQAVADDRVKAIVLRVNSPGGEVTASDIIYAAVKKAAEAKPVIVYMDSVAASGGYYVACGATKVIASETTLTASIGVIMASTNYHELYGKVGLSSQTFTSGAFKDTLSGSRPMREDEKAYVQGLVDTMYDRFLGIVSEARNVPKDVLRNTVADGRVVTGRQALEAKLVDQIGYIEDAYALARELGAAPDATVVKYQSVPNLFTALGLASAKATPPAKMELDLTGAMLPKLQPGMMYYLPGSFLH
ncbi:protease-4 [Prosthecobacter fusiformis]|uniref:Protease-4 n=1 Tax=Prosthecobacter fusiformis TaxID=48464 RepID=A0A4R7RJD9_9BACT|nr:signal peptide peptidase SppA [Prosthecobacter fusiformis]TDU62560.1 protease-4 [Prosthecobacter fusiformis]